MTDPQLLQRGQLKVVAAGLSEPISGFSALGLSEIAIKAGARSAIGTLCKVNDAATSELITEFYRQLQIPDVSRATALQQAQLKLEGDLRHRHPGYWSAFLLLNSWL